MAKLSNIIKQRPGSGGTAPVQRYLLTGLLSILFIAILALGAGAASSIPSPSPELYVLDQANVISSDTEALIINTSQELHRLTKAQVAVVTLNTLDDRPIEEVALGILREWKLGDKELNNGLLVLLVPSEHQARIEVGYGLEGVLPDAKTGRIQDEYMLPDFEAENYDQGLRNGYLQLVDEVAREYGVQLDAQPSAQPHPQTDRNTGHGLPLWADILLVLGLLTLFWLDYRFLDGLIFGIILSMIFRGRGGGGGFGGGGGSSGGGGSGGGGGSSRGW